jgi:flagellar protein FlbB
MKQPSKVGNSMAKKNTPDSQIKLNINTPEKTKKKLGTIFKVLLVIIILLLIAVTGFATGVYLNLIDMEGLTKSWKLNECPVVGQYFPQPKTNFETVELEEEQSQVNPSTELRVVPPVPSIASEVPIAARGIIDDSELQKQAKIKQQEEAKRISKLARLYGGMKPDEAVAILNQLDDNVVLGILNKMEDEQVSKIMPLFDSRRAANLTQAMYRGRNNN